MELNEHNKQEYPPMHTYEVHFSFFRQKNIRTKEDGEQTNIKRIIKPNDTETSAVKICTFVLMSKK